MGGRRRRRGRATAMCAAVNVLVHISTRRHFRALEKWVRFRHLISDGNIWILLTEFIRVYSREYCGSQCRSIFLNRGSGDDWTTLGLALRKPYNLLLAATHAKEPRHHHQSHRIFELNNDPHTPFIKVRLAAFKALLHRASITCANPCVSRWSPQKSTLQS